jgi:hypothetical protein
VKLELAIKPETLKAIKIKWLHESIHDKVKKLMELTK